MGADYTSYAVIGIEIDPEKLKIRTKIRGCDCVVDYDKDSPPTFCSKCGKDFMEDDWDYIDEFDDGENTLRGYKVAFGTDDQPVYICLTIAEDDDYGEKSSFAQIPTNEMKEKFKNAMSLEFWDEKKFGMYSVLYCSY